MSLIEPTIELCALVGKQLACSTQDQLTRKCGCRLALAEQRTRALQRLVKLGVASERYTWMDGRHYASVHHSCTNMGCSYETASVGASKTA